MRALVGVLVVVIFFCLPSPAAADERVPLAALVERALAGHPGISAAARRVEAARQRPVQERSLPDPMLSAGYNSSGNPLPGAGLGTEPTANIGVMVTQELPYPGKRDLRAAVAAREIDVEQHALDAVKLRIASQVKEAYYRLAYTYAAEDVLIRNRQLLNTLLQVSEARYGVGRAAQQDVIKAQAELTIVELQLERVRLERRTREAALNALIGAAPNAPVGRPEDLAPADLTVPVETLLMHAAAHAPMLRREGAMVRQAEAAVQVAASEWKPDFAVSAGYYNMGSMPAMYMFRFDVQVPLQRERRRAAVREQTARADEARSTVAATERELAARIQEDYQMAATAQRLATLYRDTVLPQTRLALESSMAGYETGAVDFLAVLTNFTAALEYEMSYFEELASLRVALSRIEAMTGTPVGL